MFLLIAIWNQFLESFLVLELSAVWIPFNTIKPDGTLLVMQKTPVKYSAKLNMNVSFRKIMTPSH